MLYIFMIKFTFRLKMSIIFVIFDTPHNKARVLRANLIKNINKFHKYLIKLYFNYSLIDSIIAALLNFIVANIVGKVVHNNSPKITMPIG